MLRTSGTVQVGKNVYKIAKNGQITKTGTKTPKKGWKNEEGATFYYVNGVKITGIKKIGGKKYLFDADGRLAKNKFATVNGKDYCGDASGVLYTGMKKVSGKYYFFDTAGVKKTGWQTSGGKTYYFDKNGVRAAKGWITVGGKEYYLSPARATGEVKIGGKYYRFDKNGVKMTGRVSAGGYTYIYDEDGVKITNTAYEIDGVTYTLDESGRITGPGVKITDGEMQFYDESGKPLRDEYVDYGGEKYYVDSEGSASIHEHVWEDVTKIIEHPEEGHYEDVLVDKVTVVDQEAWDEPHWVDRICCNTADCDYICYSGVAGSSEAGNEIERHTYFEHGGLDVPYYWNEVWRYPSYCIKRFNEPIHHDAVTHEEEIYDSVYVKDKDAWKGNYLVGHKCVECGDGESFAPVLIEVVE